MDYDLRIVDSPAELRDMIFEKNQINNKARLVAGYCWDWKSKGNKNAYDIVFPEYNFSMRWNLASYGSLWIIQPGAVNEIGCLHTCQGLELDYIGVIVGPDLIFRNGKIITDALEHPSRDRALKGIRQRLRKEPESAKAAADSIIKNTYKTLMTRGMKGCYVYFTDKQTSEYFKTRIEAAPADAVQPLKHIPTVIKKSLVIVPAVEPAYRFKEYLPIYNLEAACGYFGKGNAAQPDSWIKIETGRQLDRNMFVSRVIGRSMEPRINDGDYCVFRANVVGSRNDKIVLVQHNSISDPDTGGKYTVKKYTSKKKYFPDGTWGHEEITLLPLNPNYSPISIKFRKQKKKDKQRASSNLFFYPIINYY